MKKLIPLFFLFHFSFHSTAQIVLDTFAIGLSVPIDIKHAGDNRVFIVQQSGIIKIFDTTGTYVRDFINLSSIIAYGGEQGLLGLAFDPDYVHNGFFYVNYTAVTTGETHVSRFQVSTNPDSAIASSERILLRIYQPFTNHNGGHVAFRDGYLYIGMGDGGAGGDPYNNGQNLDSLLAKILRIDVSDTSVDYINPPSNPFVGVAGRDEIWDYGVRNPWRWSFDRWTGDFWIGDVGQNAYEEIDFEPANSSGGVNYGWNCYEANHVYSASTYPCSTLTNQTYPVLEVPHSLGVCAIIGGYVYRGAEYSNLWGKYFFSDECTSAIGLHSIDHIGNNFYDSLALAHGGTFVSFGEDKYGEMYIADYGGRVYKMRGASCSPTAVIGFRDTILNCYGTPLNFHTPEGRSFHYQWMLNGSPVGTDSSGLNATTAGDYTVVTTDRNGCSATSSVVHVSNAVPPVVYITGADTMYCVYHVPVSFTGNPSGGTFTGNGMTGNTFDPSIAGVGYDTVIYAYTDTITGCADSSSAIIHVDACVGIGENDAIVSMSLFPNPNKGDFTLSIVARNAANLQMEIRNVLGETISARTVTLRTGANSFNFENNLASGVYTLKLFHDNVSSARSFVVN